MKKRFSLRRQLGFLFLTTGANGAGKTLFTLLDVRKLQLETSRPVFFNGFTAKQPLLDFGWQEFEPEKWQDCPDGSILVIDECHLKLPLRGSGKPPEWIEMIPVTHRKRGMDIFFITQHPMNMDAFIRRVIAAPGWHRHFKASFMGDSSNELRWTSVNDQPQKPGSGKSGQVSSRKFPKEVYSWYESASLHTAKKGIPPKVWMGVGALIVAIVCVVLVVRTLVAQTRGSVAENSKLVDEAKKAGGVAAPTGQADAQRSSGAGPRGTLTAAEYVDQRTPRLPDFAHTAPVYDGVTVPVVAPYPAACIQMARRCECFSQQGTRLIVSLDTCQRIVRNGYFVDWQQPQQRPAEERREVHAATPAQRPVQVAMVPPAAPESPVTSSWSEALAARNAQVRSSLGR